MDAEEVLVWRFLHEDRYLGRRPNEQLPANSHPAIPGDALHARSWNESTLYGLHGWRFIVPALRHGRGLIAARLCLSGECRTDKGNRIGATDASVLWVADVTHSLNNFAVLIAERTLLAERTAGREPDIRFWQFIEVRRAWLSGTASQQELDAAIRAMRKAWQELVHGLSPVQEKWRSISRESQLLEWEGNEQSSEERTNLRMQLRVVESQMHPLYTTVMAANVFSGIDIDSPKVMQNLLVTWNLLQRLQAETVVHELAERLDAEFGTRTGI